MASSSESLPWGTKSRHARIAFQGSASGFETTRLLGVLDAGETLFLNCKYDLAPTKQGGRTFVVGTIDSQDQPSRCESHLMTSPSAKSKELDLVMSPARRLRTFSFEQAIPGDFPGKDVRNRQIV